jgi:hypothetical protein
MHIAIRAAVGVIVTLVIGLPVLTKPLFSQAVSEQSGKIYFHKKNGATVQITSLGLDTDPSLSFDKRLVVFVRRTPSHKIDTAIGPVDLNELWIAETSGKTEARRVLQGRDGSVSFAGIPFAGFHEPRFSLDGGRVYFTEEIGGPCHEIWMLGLESGALTNIIKGLGLEVIESGDYTGHLIVLKMYSWSMATPHSPVLAFERQWSRSERTSGYRIRS